MAAAAAQEARVQRSRTKGRECVACDQDRAPKSQKFIRVRLSGTCLDLLEAYKFIQTPSLQT